MGRALFFDQRFVHEGIPPISDRKHIIRTDVMFQRIEPLFVEYANEYADYERAAPFVGARKARGRDNAIPGPTTCPGVSS